MESPIYQKLNSACRNHDESQIMILGPYAMALKTILGKIEKHGRKDDPERLGKGKKRGKKGQDSDPTSRMRSGVGRRGF